MAVQSDADLIAQILLTGSEKVKQQIIETGQVGQEVFDKLEKAGGKDFASGIKKLVDASNKSKTALTGVADAASRTGSAVGAVGSAAAAAGGHFSWAGTIQNAFSAIGTAGQAVIGRLQQIGTGLAAAGTAAQHAGERTNHFASTLRDLAIAAVAVEAAHKAIEFIKHQAEAAEETQNFADSLGLSVKEFTKWEFAANESGVATQKFRLGMTRLSEELNKIKQTGASEALDKLFLAAQRSTNAVNTAGAGVGELSKSLDHNSHAAEAASAPIQELSVNVDKTIKVWDSAKGIWRETANEVANGTSRFIDLSKSVVGSSRNIVDWSGAADQSGKSATTAAGQVQTLNKAVEEGSGVSVVAGGKFRTLAGDAAKFGEGINVVASGVSRFTSGSEILKRSAAEISGPLKVAGGSIQSLDNELRLKLGATLPIIGDAFKAIKDPVERTAAAVELFGLRVGPSFIPFLLKSREELEHVSHAFETLGKGANERIKTLTDLNHTFELTGAVTRALREEIGALFAPSIIALFQTFSKAVIDNWDKIITAIKAVAAEVTPTIDKLTEGLKRDPEQVVGWVTTAIKVFATLAKAVTVAVGIIVPVVRGIGTALQFVADAINTLTFGWTNLDATTIGVAFILAKVLGVFGLLTSAIGGTVSAVKLLITGIAFLIANPLVAFIALVVAGLILLAVALSKVDWAAFAEQATTAWNQLVEFIKSIPDLIVAKWNEILAFFAGLWAQIVAETQAAWADTVALVSGAVATVVGLWDQIKQAGINAWEGIKSTVTSVVQYVIGQINAVLDKIKQWIAAARAAVGASSEGGATQGLAGGGMVRGPGSETSDSVGPVWLSNREWVMKAAAVKKYGTRFMALVNSLRFDPRTFRGFAGGGLVDRLSMLTPTPIHMASGGPVPAQAPGRSFTLNIAGEVFEGLFAPEDTADRLVRYAVSRQMRSGGKKPGYYGGGR